MSRLLSRRQLLSRSFALGCSAAASPFLTPVALASAPSDNRLVVIILRGAMDGMDVFRPLGDPHFTTHRPGLARVDEALPLDNFFGLHPDLAGLLPLWQAGEMAFAPATSTPYRDRRSHFDGQDHLEAGTSGALLPALQRDGWLNRMLTLMPGADARTAFAVGRERMLILDGAAPMTQWSPGTELDLTPQSRLLLSFLFMSDPLFAEAGETALELTGNADIEAALQGNLPQMTERAAPEDGEDVDLMSELDADEARTAMAESAAEPQLQRSASVSDSSDPIASYVAEQLNGTSRIASFSLSGWDTHFNQAGALRGALGRLERSILTLRRDLGANWSRTTVLAMTEFGRTVRENGSNGTDHGTGGALLMAGGALRGGRAYGAWPGLSEGALYRDRDLMPERDIRAYAGWVMRDAFGLSASDIERVIFPGLDAGANPGLLL